MVISAKYRRFIAMTTMLAFIIASLIMPGPAYAGDTSAVPVTGCWSGTQSNNPGIAAQDFTDTQAHPAKAEIRVLHAMGLVSGYPDGSFHPDDGVTQIEALAMVMGLAGNGDGKTGAIINDEELSSVPDWGKPAASKAVQMGIISADHFQSGVPATRVRIMVWLAQAIGMEPEEGSLPFNDSHLILSADQGYIRAFFNKGIIKIPPQGNFEPNEVMSRAQLAVVLKDIIDKNPARDWQNSDSNLVSLDILTINDFHGALAEEGKNPGAAKLAQWLKNEKALNPDGTLILSAGDMSQGSIDSNLLYGKTVIQAMNEIGFDAMAVGNHEFDWGLNCLKNQAAWARFPILTANVMDKKTGHCLEGTQPWIIVEKKGVKIGIIGVTTEEITNLVSPKVLSTCNINQPAEIINRLVPELRQQGAQVIIVLAHLGGYLDTENNIITGEVTELANAVSGVDVLVTGHTHQKISGYINGMAVVQAYCNGRAVGHITLKYSPQSEKVLSAIPSVIDLPTPGLTEDTRVKTIIDEGQKELSPVKNEIIGKNLTELSHQRDQLSLLGQWATDIMRQATYADIAFQNGGGLRTSIPAGNITVGKLWEVLPFDNTLIVMDMKGSQVMQTLQYGINNSEYGSLQYSGIKVKYDPLLLPGDGIVEVTLPDGSRLNPEKIYRVVTNDFMAGGGDEYTMFKEGSNITDTHLLFRDVLINSIKESEIIDFKADDRLLYEGVGYRRESAVQIYQPDQTAFSRAA